MEKNFQHHMTNLFCALLLYHHTHKQFSESLVLSKFNSLILRVGCYSETSDLKKGKKKKSDVKIEPIFLLSLR